MGKDMGMLIRTVAVALAVVLAGFTAACGGEGQGGQASGGGELTAAVGTEPATLDPLFGSAPGGPDRYIYNMFYDSLIRMTVDRSFVPSLAKSYEVGDKGTSITFELRDGVEFHDGEPLDAEAVVANLERVTSEDVAAPRGSDVRQIESVEAVDRTTVRVNLSQPAAPVVLAGLAHEAGMMVSPKALEDPEKLARNPVGTGPFRFVEFASGQRVVGERFGEYWRQGEGGRALPYLDKVTVRFIPEVATKLVELRSGSVQLTDVINPRDYKTVEDNPDLQAIEAPSGNHQWMTFNLTRPPFDNEDLRKAILYGIDRQEISDTITLGNGEVTPTLVAPDDLGYTEDLPAYGHDPDRARDLLAESGNGDGIDASLSIINRDPDAQIAQLLQSQLQKIGVNLEIETLEREAWVEKVLAYEYEAALLRIGVPRPDPDQVFAPSFAADAATNWAGVENEELFRVVDEAAATTDEQERADLYGRAQEILLEEGYYGFLYYLPIVFAATSDVQGFATDIDGGWRLEEVRLGS